MTIIPLLHEHNLENPAGVIQFSVLDNGLLLEFQPPLERDIFFEIFPSAGVILLEADFTSSKVFFRKIRLINLSISAVVLSKTERRKQS